MSAPIPSLTLIVAATTANGIGLSGGLPWRLPAEMKYFAKVTTSACGATAERPNAVLMGRKTWDGIPPKFRPLKGRRNVVLSRQPELVDVASAEQTTAVATLDGALASPALQTANHAFLIGGAELYALALSPPSPSSSSSSSPAPPPAPAVPLVDRILLTRILSPSFECDAHLAEFRASGLWVQAPAGALGRWVGWDVDDETVQEEKGVRYAFEMWVRKDAGGAEASG